jgi:hypothetical protein
MRAAERREAELEKLAAQGIRVTRLSRWHYQVGPIHFWVATGRWTNEATNERGRINGIPLRRFVDLSPGELRPRTPKSIK